MVNAPQVEIDGKNGKVVFHGSCLELGPVCQARCCRFWVVGISADEYASGRYDAEAVCGLTDKVCRTEAKTCLHRQYQLSRREDRSCVYLKENRCAIYESRPRVCRDFQCSSGWQLASVAPESGGAPDQRPPLLTREIFLAQLNSEAIFVQHPLIKVHTVFCLKPRREIIFVKQMVGSCGKFNTRNSFDHPQLDDSHVLSLIDLFNRKEPLRQIHERFGSQCAVQLTELEFREVVWVLNRHNIVLDCRNFPGMLKGMGRTG